MRRLSIFCLMIFAIFPLASQGTDLVAELKKASEISIETDRLEAYDEILEKYGIKTVNKEIDTGYWVVDVSINPIDDSQEIEFFLSATSGNGVYGDRIYLIIRYRGGKSELYINWNSYLGSEAIVTMRVGTKEATSSEWMLSTDKKATFYPGDVKALIKEIISVNKLVFQCTPYSENPITVIFDVDGLENAILKYNDVLMWL